MSNFKSSVIKRKRNLYLFCALTILFCLASIMAASAQNGFISVYSFPSGAKVYLDGGYYIGQTPLESRGISPGNHKITLVLLNYDKYAEVVSISPGESLNRYVNLAPIFGKVKLTPELEGALVYINNEYVGTAPLTIHLGPGSYLLELIKPNYHKWSKVVIVYADQTVSIRAKLEIIIPSGPDSCSTLINKGKNYYSNGLCAEAVMSLRKAIQVCPNPWEAYYYLGESYKCLKLYNEAIEAFKKAIELNPKYYKSYRGLGYVYNEIKLYDEAIDAYLKAINLNSESDLLYTLLGIAYNNAGLISEAIKCHNKAISINPKDTTSYGYLGDIYLHNGLYDEAIKSYKKAVSVNPNNKYTHYHLGNAYLECDLYNEAIKSYEQALLRIDPAYREAHFGLGVAYIRLGDKDSAKREYETLKKLDSPLAEKLYVLISK
jgi:tetratricopeptide (TPR) repeat protein